MPTPTFNIEYQYALYLKRMSLSEATMHPQQKIQIKQTFMGAFGQVLIMLRDDLGALPEDEAITQMQSLLDQVERFWVREVEQYKARNQ